jgi:regulator of protease activity HflC (stomatin/prohibitin superfamily)
VVHRQRGGQTQKDKEGETMKYVSLSVIGLLALIFAIGGWTTVPAGHRGVEIRMGKVTGRILEEGMAAKTPLLVSVQDMEVRIQKEQVRTEGASKDLQVVQVEAALNYNADPKRVAELFRDVGMDYMKRVVDPAMQESVKAVIAQYTAEELVTKREPVRAAIKLMLSDKLSVRGIVVDEFSIVDFDFSKSFNEAIEAKVTAEQQALAAKNKLSQIQYEADQKIAEAKGKAEAMRVEAISLEKSPQILQLRALEKWNGVLPTVTAGAVPFIDVGKLASK